MLIEYWRSGALHVNLGDYLIEAILDAAGIPVECFSQARLDGTLKRHERCLLGVGTVIDSYWFDSIPLHKDIWGCGYGGDPLFLESTLRDNATFHAVRGPLTRSALGLPDDFPTGDPGLLLPRFFDVRGAPSGKVIYIPHFESRDRLPRYTLQDLGADEYVDISCLRHEFEGRIGDIANARFVMTSSLHGGIIAQAYGVPWALCSPPGSIHNLPYKWEDWFAYLGIRLKFCRDLREAESWWEKDGSKGRIGDLSPLIKAFPGPSLGIS